MNDFLPRSANLRCLRRIMMISGLALLGPLAIPTLAVPIRKQEAEAAITARDLRGWMAYLSGGPQLWTREHDPKVTLSARTAIDHALQQTEPLSSPWIQYLEWRRDLDPARFDHWHPRLGPELAQLLPNPTTTTVTAAQQPPKTPTSEPQQLTPPPTTPPPTTPPPTTPPPTTPPIIPPPNIPPVQIPEPSSLAISIVLIGAGAWWRWPRRENAVTRPKTDPPRA